MFAGQVVVRLDRHAVRERSVGQVLRVGQVGVGLPAVVVVLLQVAVRVLVFQLRLRERERIRAGFVRREPHVHDAHRLEPRPLARVVRGRHVQHVTRVDADVPFRRRHAERHVPRHGTGLLEILRASTGRCARFARLGQVEVVEQAARDVSAHRPTRASRPPAPSSRFSCGPPPYGLFACSGYVNWPLVPLPVVNVEHRVHRTVLHVHPDRDDVGQRLARRCGHEVDVVGDPNVELVDSPSRESCSSEASGRSPWWRSRTASGAAASSSLRRPRRTARAVPASWRRSATG